MTNQNTLTRWTRPSNYCGESWPEYFQSGVGQSRDSVALERSNFDAMVAALKAVGEPENWTHDFAPFQIVRESHWAVGWVEWIAIHESATALLERASGIMEKFDGYPVIDEERMSRYETDEANETWKNCYSPKERVEYMRDHESQFEFHSLADMLGCVRGKYFAGYASELIA